MTELDAYYYFRDHLGSVRELIDGSGTIKTRYTYDPYGRTTTNHLSGSVDATFQYAKLYAHQPSGLDLPTLRGGYDPNVGRFIARDPIAERGGINLYEYVGNDPIDWTDRTGLDRSIDDHIHETVYVETWSADCCHKTGWVRIDFSADPTSVYNYGLAGATYGSRFCPAMQVGFALMNYNGYVSVTPSGPPPKGDTIVSSSCQADKSLLEQAQNLHNHPPSYSPFLYNCRNFANQAMKAGMK